MHRLEQSTLDRAKARRLACHDRHSPDEERRVHHVKHELVRPTIFQRCGTFGCSITPIVCHDGMEIAAEMNDLNAVLQRVRGSLCQRIVAGCAGRVGPTDLEKLQQRLGVLENSIAEAGVAQI
jgi:hypothetical protein